MTPERAHELQEMKRAAEILGELPNGSLGTQEVVYRAYKILSDEIEWIEAAEMAELVVVIAIFIGAAIIVNIQGILR